MLVKNVHYGLSLLYSYLLPLVSIEEEGWGFRLRVLYGSARGVECSFREDEVVAECKIPPGVEESAARRVLGLEKHGLFVELCSLAGMGGCASSLVTLLYDPGAARYVFYAIYLSRNTDYYVNTIKWTREALERGFVESTSYIPREFNKAKKQIDEAFEYSGSFRELVARLAQVRGVGAKSIAALMLHGYGLTEHAPVDRHYAKFLGAGAYQPPKRFCISRGFDCPRCEKLECPYRVAASRLGPYNGVVQSLVYIKERLESRRRSRLEEVLVRDPSHYVDGLERLLGVLRERLLSHDISLRGETLRRR